jgi:hypothetical protein
MACQAAEVVEYESYRWSLQEFCTVDNHLTYISPLSDDERFLTA